MIALAVTLVYFTFIGWATSRLLRLKTPAAMLYLTGVAANGIVLYLLAVVQIPITRITIAVVAIAAAAASIRGAGAPRDRAGHSTLATLLLAIPCLALVIAAAVLPIRDYDGRVTWLPKAIAIAGDHHIDGAFFQGAEGLNLHNHYPLLIPLDAATVMTLCGNTEPETARWLYVFIPIAALFAARALLASRAGDWVIAATAWLPVLTLIDGGALAAYNDWAIAAFTGMAVLYAMEADGARAAGLFLAALILTKNEGAMIAAAVVVAMLVARRKEGWPWLIAPAVATWAMLAFWRWRVPPAYDEQYALLARELPNLLGRAPAALRALALRAIDPSTWGFFWPVTAIALIAAATRRQRDVVIPATTLLLVLTAYVAALTVTSWNVDELAAVAASRLLLHVAIPACTVITLSMRNSSVA